MDAARHDLIVIGGGINGTAIARDAALRGLSVCLLEQDDLCAATTRGSSRLIHGGLRYLEHGELGLVHESLRERERLLRNAPHLVRPLPLVIPVRAGSRRGLNTIDFGLWIYDALSLGRSLPGHRRLSAAEVVARLPALDATGLAGGVEYHDAQVCHVERLVVEQALCARAHGATVLTRWRAERLLHDAGRITGVVARDLTSSVVQTFHARVVINAAGPWVDRVLAGAGRPLPRQLDVTSGTHLIVPRFEGLGEVACYAEARRDGRPFFTLPWNGMVLIGTTDVRYRGDPAALRASAADVDYLLDEAQRLFPAAGLDRAAIRYCWAGLRPLPRQGPRDTGAITRRHHVRRHAGLRGLHSVLGGKITTCRQLAEDVVDALGPLLGRPLPACPTADLPLPGGRAGEAAVHRALAAFPAIGAASRAHLWQVYGARAAEVAELTCAAPDLAATICAHSHAIAAEVVHAVRTEGATTLGDVLLRRCMAGLSPDLGRGAVAATLAVAAHHLGWGAARCAAEQGAYERELAAFAVP